MRKIDIVILRKVLTLLLLLNINCEVFAQDQYSNLIEKVELFITYRGQLDSALHYLNSVPLDDQESIENFELYYFVANQKQDTINLEKRFETFLKKSEKSLNALTYLKTVIFYSQYLQRQDLILEAKSFLLSEIPKIKLTKHSTQDYVDLTAKIYSELGGIYLQKDELEDAHKYGMKAEKIAESTKNLNVLIQVTRLLKDTYLKLASKERNLISDGEKSRYDTLIESYLKKSTEYCLATKDLKLLAIAYCDNGSYFASKQNIPEAKNQFNKAITIFDQLKDSWNLAIAYNTLSNYSVYLARTTYATDKHASQFHLDTLAVMIDSSMKYALLANNENVITNILITQANNFIGQNKFDEARPVVMKAIRRAEAKSNFSKMMVGYHTRYVIAKYTNELDSALFYYKLKMEAKDSILDQQHYSKILELNKKYETEKLQKENLSLLSTTEIQNLKLQKNKLLFSILALLLTCIFGVIIFFINRKSKRHEQHLIKTELKLLRSQLNPHFLYNALNAIQQYIYQQEDPTVIADYLAKFSRLTRKILLYSREEYISVQDEVTFLNDYIDLQRIRFDKPFEYSIEVEDHLLDKGVIIPPMFTQPFLENSIEHGILSKRGDGKILIKMSQDKEDLLIEIEDNGIGVKQSVFRKKNDIHRSVATEITRERLIYIQKKEKRKTSLTILDLSDFNNLITGTIVKLRMPLMYES